MVLQEHRLVLCNLSGKYYLTRATMNSSRLEVPLGKIPENVALRKRFKLN